MNSFKTIGIFSLIAAGTLAGCASVPVEIAEQKIEHSFEEASKDLAKGREFMSRSSTYWESDGIFVSHEPFRVSERDILPKFFERAIDINVLEPMSVSAVLDLVSKKIGHRVMLAQDAVDHLDRIAQRYNIDFEEELGLFMPATTEDPVGRYGSDVRLRINHEGTIASLLDDITSRLNLYWKWDNTHVKVFRLDTRVFSFDSFKSKVGMDAQVRSSRSGNDDNSNSLSSHQSMMVIDPRNTIDDLSSLLDSMITDQGSYAIAESVGTITVTDTPDALRAIEEIIDANNKALTQQITLDVKIVDVSLEDTGNAGMDFHAIFENSNIGIDFISQGLDLTMDATAGNLQFNLLRPQSRWANSAALINALRQNTNVSIVNETTQSTTNGMSVPVQVIEEVAYLKESEVSTDNDGNQTVSLRPDITTSGVTMNILPRVLSTGEIMLQMAIDMAQIREISNFEASGSRIQLPRRSTKALFQRAIMRSGEPIMLTGFVRKENSSETRSLGSKALWWLGGNRSGGESKVMTMVIVTPYLMSR